MKFASVALALLALPAAFASPDPNPNPAPAPESPAAEPHLEARTTCTNLQRATCYVLGMEMDTSCRCKLTTVFNLPQPCGDKKYTSCPLASAIAKCWDNGQTANSLCQCVGTPTTSSSAAATTSTATVPAPGTCTDFIRVAACAFAGKKTDGNCNCVTGTPSIPSSPGSGWQTCGDSTKVGTCWKQGWGCNAKCVCETPTASTSTSTAPPKTSTAPPAVTSVAGTCTDFIKIAICALEGKKADGACNCVTGTPSTPSTPGSGWQTCGDATKVGTCWKQGWGCNAKCVCETPSTTPTTPTSTTTTSTAVSTPSTTKTSTTSTAVSTPTPSVCLDFVKIALCALGGKKTDGSCNCISGTPSYPSNPGTGWQSCGDATQIGHCWKQGWGCNAKCVCETPSSTATTSTATSTTTSKTSTRVSTTTTTSTTTATPTPSVCLDFVKIALCALSGKKTDGSCNCISGTPSYPSNPGTGWQSCGDATQIGHCWKQGWGCNAKCVCETTSTTPSTTSTATKTSATVSTTSTTSTKSSTTTTTTSTTTSTTTTRTSTTPSPTPVPGTCRDWFKIARCHLEGMKTDGACNCVPGTPVVPGGGSDCKDVNSLANCWMVGKGCSAKCVCEPLSSSSPSSSTSSSSAKPMTSTVAVTTTATSTPAPPTSTSTATSSAAPTPTAVGQCKDAYKIQLCALRGLGVNADCSCNKCNCDAQWACVKKGGTLDAGCNCLVPSGVSVKRRRDASYVNSLCPAGQSACRVESSALGWDGAFECVDTATNIESCGGCVAEGSGVDCTAIEGVSDVACIASRCVVSTCRKGWKVEDGKCVPDSNAVKFQQRVLGGNDFWHV